MDEVEKKYHLAYVSNLTDACSFHFEYCKESKFADYYFFLCYCYYSH